MTLKCDVFSFVVVLLEVISGQRNCAEPSLLSHVIHGSSGKSTGSWTLLDPAVPRPRSDADDLLSELRRCIQIGLRCVQRSPGNRPAPAMSEALSMLTSRTSQLDQPSRPGPSSSVVWNDEATCRR
ncbi:unnamed protein product [Urochloa humidicola]